MDFPSKINNKLNTLKGTFDLVAIGGLPYDYIATNPCKTLAEAQGFSGNFGGGEPYLAANLVKIGGAASIIGSVGGDQEGIEIKNVLQKLGIETSGIETLASSQTTKVYLSLTNEGEPDIRAERDADFKISFSKKTEETLERGKVLHAGLLDLQHQPARDAILKAVEFMCSKQKIVCFDPIFKEKIWPQREEALELLSTVLKYTDFTKPSENDAEELFGKGLTKEEYIANFHELGAEVVILTLGDKGALVSNNQTITPIKALPVKAVSSVGAGDAFWAGLIYSITHHASLTQAAQIGAIAGAITVQSTHGVGAIPPFAELEQIRQSNF